MKKPTLHYNYYDYYDLWANKVACLMQANDILDYLKSNTITVVMIHLVLILNWDHAFSHISDYNVSLLDFIIYWIWLGIKGLAHTTFGSCFTLSILNFHWIVWTYQDLQCILESELIIFLSKDKLSRINLWRNIQMRYFDLTVAGVEPPV